MPTRSAPPSITPPRQRPRARPHPLVGPRDRVCAALLATTLLGLAAPANADRGQDGRGSGAQGLSADQAAERVRRQTGGRVLRVEPAASGYRVKVLTPAGEVREVVVSGGR